MAQPRRRSTSGPRFEVAAAFTASLAAARGTVFAPGGTVEASVGPARSGFAARLALVGLALRDEPLGPGSATWSRATLALGPQYRFVTRRVLFDVHAEGLLALLTVKGSGNLTTTEQAFDVDPGVGGGVRLALRLGNVSLFVGAAAAGWLRVQQVRATNLADTTTLPRFEVLLSVGAGLGRFE